MGIYAKGDHKVEEHFRGAARITNHLGGVYDGLYVSLLLILNIVDLRVSFY